MQLNGLFYTPLNQNVILQSLQNKEDNHILVHVHITDLIQKTTIYYVLKSQITNLQLSSIWCYQYTSTSLEHWIKILNTVFINTLITWLIIQDLKLHIFEERYLVWSSLSTISTLKDEFFWFTNMSASVCCVYICKRYSRFPIMIYNGNHLQTFSYFYLWNF